MAKFSLKGATVSIAGTSSCVSDGNVDFGELNLVETTCTTNYTKTYEAGTFEAASGSVTLNSTTALSAWLGAYDDGTPPTGTTTILFTWPDTGAATISITGFITNVSLPVGVDASYSAAFSFTGTGAITFTP
jgi:hypothetical protein